MEWKILYETLIENDLLVEAINCLKSESNFTLNTGKKIEFRKLDEGKTEGISYDDFRSKIMYAVLFEDKVVSVGIDFLKNSLKSQELNQKLKKELNYNFTFFDFQFELYMIFAADISSGQTWFKNSVGDILKSFKIGKINLNGLEMSNENELISYLRNNFNGLKEKTDNEIKKYYEK